MTCIITDRMKHWGDQISCLCRALCGSHVLIVIVITIWSLKLIALNWIAANRCEFCLNRLLWGF